jgi:hypothetical protein
VIEDLKSSSRAMAQVLRAALMVRRDERSVCHVGHPTAAAASHPLFDGPSPRARALSMEFVVRPGRRWHAGFG